MALGALALLGGCTSGSDDDLATFVCQDDDVPGRFERLAFGALGASELGREVGVASLTESGIISGYFSFWREQVDDSRVELPRDLLCQVIAFGIEAEATAYLAAMRPTAGSLSVTGAGVPIDRRAGITELDADWVGQRVFRVAGPGDDLRFVVVQTRRDLLISVHLSGGSEFAAQAEAHGIADAMAR